MEKVYQLFLALFFFLLGAGGHLFAHGHTAVTHNALHSFDRNVRTTVDQQSHNTSVTLNTFIPKKQKDKLYNPDDEDEDEDEHTQLSSYKKCLPAANYFTGLFYSLGSRHYVCGHSKKRFPAAQQFFFPSTCSLFIRNRVIRI